LTFDQAFFHWLGWPFDTVTYFDVSGSGFLRLLRLDLMEKVTTGAIRAESVGVIGFAHVGFVLGVASQMA